MNRRCCDKSTFDQGFRDDMLKQHSREPDADEWKRAYRNWNQGNTGWEAAQIEKHRRMTEKEAERDAIAVLKRMFIASGLFPVASETNIKTDVGGVMQEPPTTPSPK